MIESHFIRTLSAYFGMPLIMFVCIVLLLFWFCRLFQNTAITNLPNNQPRPENQNRPALPLRPINLRNVAGLVMALSLCQILAEQPFNPTVDATDSKTLCSSNPKKAFQKVEKYIESCAEQYPERVRGNYGTI